MHSFFIRTIFLAEAEANKPIYPLKNYSQLFFLRLVFVVAAVDDDHDNVIVARF